MAFGGTSTPKDPSPPRPSSPIALPPDREKRENS
jgi:hypothetical protein